MVLSVVLGIFMIFIMSLKKSEMPDYWHGCPDFEVESCSADAGGYRTGGKTSVHSNYVTDTARENYCNALLPESKQCKTPESDHCTSDRSGGGGYVGTFGLYPNSVGIKFLDRSVTTPDDASAADARRIANALGAAPNATWWSYPDEEFLREPQRRALMAHMDNLWTPGARDEKIVISDRTLAALVGRRVVVRLSGLMDGNYNEVLLRRCEDHGRLMEFHTDSNETAGPLLRTLQVPLNEEDGDYEGGRLVFVTPDGLATPRRPAGSATVHEIDAAHGVTTLVRGVRYGLFLLRVQGK